MQRSTPPHGTSLLLIALTLVVGVGLGWLARDLLGGQAAPPAVPSATLALAPTSAPTLAAQAPTPAATSAPTAAPPTFAPTAPPATAAPTATLVPVTPTDAPVVAYAGHVVAEGETLETIAARGGSAPDLIARYNWLDGEPQPGRELIIPQLAGQDVTLDSAPILVQRGHTEKPWVALTLDAGASAEPVPAILKTLREHNVRITFFLTGKWIKENPELTREIVADGHEIANHTFNHPDLTRVGDDVLRQELADTEALLQETAPGATTRPLFRPPYGAYDERVLQGAEAAGYLPVYWTFDSLDSVGEPKTADFLYERITTKLAPDALRGAIILAHCGSQLTADALPRILDRFAEMGFEVKKVSEVLGP